METGRERWRRRLTHFTAHPYDWARYIWRREIRHREVSFNLNPRFRDYRPMFRVSRPALLQLLGKSASEIDGYFSELAPIHTSLVAELGHFPSAGALVQAPLLYIMTRAERPRWVVETGVSSGYSARWILEALARNGQGHLDSVGIDVFAHSAKESFPEVLRERSVGWIVPDRLKGMWGLHLGRSDEQLPLLFAGNERGLDIFLHDSAHKYDVMKREYALGGRALRSGGLLLSHDIHASAAWPELLQTRGLSSDVELDHDLGAVRLPGVDPQRPTGTSPTRGFE